MLANRFLLPVLLGIVLSSCEAPPGHSSQQALPALANTVWVPRTIAWEHPMPSDAELGHIETASFTLLSFRSRGQCLLVSSTHSRGDGDTIVVATEPGIRLDSGHYRLAPQRLLLTSKNLTHGVFTPPGERDEARTDTLVFTGQTLTYKGIKYRPYTKLAGRPLDSFWALW